MTGIRKRSTDPRADQSRMAHDKLTWKSEREIEDRVQAAKREKGNAALRRQENLDRLVMQRGAADKKWGKRAR